MKWTLFALLLGILAFSGQHQAADASQSIQSTGDINFGNALMMYFEAYKNVMPCGYSPQNIPIMAPYTVPFYSINYSNEFLTITGNISNLVVTGLNDYFFIESSFNNETNRLSYDLMYPSVQAAGQYMMDVTANVAGFPVSFSGKGLMDSKFSDYRIISDFIISQSPTNFNGLAISNFNLRFIIGDFQVNNWNYNWDIAANNFYNQWTRAFVLMFTEQIQPKLSEIYTNKVLPIANNYLENTSMNDAITYLLEEAVILNSADCSLS